MSSLLCNECLPGDHQTNFRLSLSNVSTCWCLSLLLPTCENTKWFAELACVLLWLQVVDESPAGLKSAAGNFHPTWLQGQPGDKERFSCYCCSAEITWMWVSWAYYNRFKKNYGLRFLVWKLLYFYVKTLNAPCHLRDWTGPWTCASFLTLAWTQSGPWLPLESQYNCNSFHILHNSLNHSITILILWLF